jgi:RHS repeat-associated protein
MGVSRPDFNCFFVNFPPTAATSNPTGYAQVVDELQNNSVTRTYSYGLERIYERQLVAGNWQLSFFGYDGHGSVRQLFSSAGAITDTYDYDAFGNLIASTGTTPNNYLFAGEQFDPALGMYFLRARYYNANTGRFWNMDTYEGSSYDPASLHKYLYTGGNPVDRLDRSGHDFTLLGVTFTLGANLTIFGMSVIASQMVIGAVGSVLFTAGAAGIGAYLEEGSPDQIEDATSNLRNAAFAAIFGAVGSVAGAYQFGRLIMTGIVLGVGGYNARRAYQSGHLGAALYYAVLAIGAAALINMAPYLQGAKAPGRLVVGGGRAPGFPDVPQGSTTLNIRASANPDTVGSISNPPYEPGQFSEVYYEYVPYTAFTGENAEAIAATSRIMSSGGRLIIDTGSRCPIQEVQSLLEENGFSNIQIVRDAKGGVTITATKD